MYSLILLFLQWEGIAAYLLVIVVGNETKFPGLAICISTCSILRERCSLKYFGGKKNKLLSLLFLKSRIEAGN